MIPDTAHTATQATHLRPSAVFEQVDGEVDVQVELQPLRRGVPVPDCAGHALLPQAEEGLLVPVIEGSQELLLRGQCGPCWAEAASAAAPLRS